MRFIIFIVILFISNWEVKSQSLVSCKEDNWHCTMQKKMKTVEAKTDTPSVKIVLHDTLPPYEWWNPFIVSRKKGGEVLKKPNPNHFYTRNKNYSDQRFVEIINTSNKNVIFTRPDKQLMLGLQAKDENGEWRDAEEFFSGICGRSFKPSYNDTLKVDENWHTFISMYKGSMQTMYRLKLLVYKDYRSDNSHHYIYSNEISGTIDPCHFIRSW